MAPEALRFVPILLNVIVALVEVAINLNHTSSSDVPVQTVEILLFVAPHTVPATLVPPTVTEVAPEQSSLLGGETHTMLKVEPVDVPPREPLIVEYTRT